MIVRTASRWNPRTLNYQSISYIGRRPVSPLNTFIDLLQTMQFFKIWYKTATFYSVYFHLHLSISHHHWQSCQHPDGHKSEGQHWLPVWQLATLQYYDSPHLLHRPKSLITWKQSPGAHSLIAISHVALWWRENRPSGRSPMSYFDYQYQHVRLFLAFCGNYCLFGPILWH